MTRDEDDEDFMFTKQSDPNEDEEEMLFVVGAWIAIAWLAWMAWLS